MDQNKHPGKSPTKLQSQHRLEPVQSAKLHCHAFNML